MPFDDAPKPKTMKITALRPSPRNRRTRVDEEFVASIREHGVIERLVVRPVPKDSEGRTHEIVCGHRRWMGAGAAGLEEVPVDVVELDERGAMEVAIIENLHRESLTPLEEADAFRWLVEEQGRSVADVAARVHRGEGYVRQRLHLHGLVPELRAHLDADAIAMDAALLLAQTPEDVQREISTNIDHHLSAHRAGGEPARIGRLDVTEWLTAHWQLLREAPFDTGDATLLETAGACGTCPRRTGTQGVLFDVVEVADACLDATCFRNKADASWARKAEAARKMGLRVLTDEEMKKIAPWDKVDRNGPWVDLAERAYLTGTSDDRRWRDIVTPATPEAIGRTPRGAVVELVERRTALAAAKAAAEARGAVEDVEELEEELDQTAGADGHADKLAQAQAQWKAEEEKRKAAEKRAREKVEASVVEYVGAAGGLFGDGDDVTRVLRCLVSMLGAATWSDVASKIVGLRKLDATDGHGGKLDHAETIERWASAATGPDAFEMLCELIVRSWAAKTGPVDVATRLKRELEAIVGPSAKAAKKAPTAKPTKAPAKATKKPAKPAGKAPTAKPAPKKSAKKAAKKGGKR